MMSRVAQLVIVAAVAAVLFAVVAKADIQCYECIPTPTKDCADESTFTTVNCPGANAYCRKMIQNVESKVSYVLQCGNAEGGMDKPYYNTANDYVKANVYHCNDKPKCNSAVNNVVSPLAAVIVVALAWMLH